MEQKKIESFSLNDGLENTDSCFYKDVESLRRQKMKGRLFDDASALLGQVARQKKVFVVLGKYGKRFMSLTVRQTYKDYKRSLKAVNSNIPVGGELPKFEKNKNGTYSVTDAMSGKKESVVPDNEMKKQATLKESKTIDVLDFTKE